MLFFELFQRLYFIDGTAIIRILGPSLICGRKLMFPILCLDLTNLEVVDLCKVFFVHQRLLEMVAGIDEKNLLFWFIDRE